MNYKCERRSIGYKIARVVFQTGQPLFGFTRPTDADLKPDTYERASVLLDDYLQAVEDGVIEAEFTPDPDHARYGLSGDYFWIRKKNKNLGWMWGLVRSPVEDGDFVWVEVRKKTTSAE